MGVSKLPIQTRVQILSMLVEGSSMRSITRVTGCSINTVTKLLEDAGRACAAFHDENVRAVKASKVQCDEIWSFCAAKEKNVPEMKKPVDGAGSVWTWTAIESDSKFIVSWLVGSRDAGCANEFMQDVAARLATRVQLTTDGLKSYLEAVEGAFGADVDFAQLVKLYGDEGAPGPERKYSPGVCTGARKMPIEGEPDPKYISTSHVERHNLTMRMSMRRFTRLTNAFSKKIENHCHALALYFVFYNFCRVHKTLRKSPAMAAGVSDTLRDMESICGLIDARAPKTGRPTKIKNT
jgi:IS1 family transposase